MEEQYEINKLMIGNLNLIQQNGAGYGTISCTEGPFIFYKVKSEEGKKEKYKEIFTEDEYKLSNYHEQQKFGKTYITKVDIDINDYIDETTKISGSISKRSLLNVYDMMREDIVKNKTSNNYTKTKQL